MWLQFLSHHHIIGGGHGTIGRTALLPCRERVSGPPSVFVQSATQILLLCSIHPTRFRHCSPEGGPPRDSTPPAMVTINL